MLALPLNQVSGSKDEQSDDDSGELHRVIEIRAEASHCPEEERHGEITTDDDQVESEEGPCVPHQAAHEVHDDAEDKDLCGRKDEIDYDLSYPQGARSVLVICQSVLTATQH